MITELARSSIAWASGSGLSDGSHHAKSACTVGSSGVPGSSQGRGQVGRQVAGAGLDLHAEQDLAVVAHQRRGRARQHRGERRRTAGADREGRRRRGEELPHGDEVGLRGEALERADDDHVAGGACVRSGRPRVPGRPLPRLRGPARRRAGPRPPRSGRPGGGVARGLLGRPARPRPGPDLDRRGAGRGLHRVQPAAPQLAARTRGRAAHPPATAGGDGVRPRPHRAAGPAGAGAGRGPGGRPGGPYPRRRPRRPGGARRRTAAGRRDRRPARRTGGPPGAAARLVGRDRADVRARPRRRRPSRGRAGVGRLHGAAAGAGRRAPVRPRRPAGDTGAGPDLITDLLAVRDAGSPSVRLDEDELVGTAALLLMAGHEATVNVVGNGVHALLRHPDQWQRLLDDPGLVGTAVEELIRFDAPLQLFERTAVVDTTVAGHPVPAGTRIATLLGAAGRDPSVFGDDADRLDVGRSPNPHLGFGAGVHYCLGAPLARLEIAEVLRALLERLPDAVVDGAPVRRPRFVMRGWAELRLTAHTVR
ncbi:hypothetical protein L7F22_007017 [Adiantum nelumboides]|nr:hypothetical protein [Adiantum nelumboides]